MNKCPTILALLLSIYVHEGSCRSKIDNVNVKNAVIVNLAGETNATGVSIPPPPASPPSTPPPPQDERDEIGRFLVTQAGTMMCYRSWEMDVTLDFHLCYVCFNETLTTGNVSSTETYISEVEACFEQHIAKTEYYSECLPKLRDSSLPNKPYDISVSEPPFSYPYQNFARCAHGVTYKQESLKCISAEDVVQGLDAFLDVFGCLMNNIVLDSRRFSEANLAELLNSVPQASQQNINNNVTLQTIKLP